MGQKINCYSYCRTHLIDGGRVVSAESFADDFRYLRLHHLEVMLCAVWLYFVSSVIFAPSETGRLSTSACLSGSASNKVKLNKNLRIVGTCFWRGNSSVLIVCNSLCRWRHSQYMFKSSVH